jgi:hypothetical protein
VGIKFIQKIRQAYFLSLLPVLVSWRILGWVIRLTGAGKNVFLNYMVLEKNLTANSKWKKARRLRCPTKIRRFLLFSLSHSFIAAIDFPVLAQRYLFAKY